MNMIGALIPHQPGSPFGLDQRDALAIVHYVKTGSLPAYGAAAVFAINLHAIEIKPLRLTRRCGARAGSVFYHLADALSMTVVHVPGRLRCACIHGLC